jgi:hypothetical protein
VDKALGAESPFTSGEVSIGSKFFPSLLLEEMPLPPSMSVVIGEGEVACEQFYGNIKCS